MKITKAVFRWVLYIAVVLLLSEGLLRTIDSLQYDAVAQYGFDYLRHARSRIHDQWLDTKHTDPFIPPLSVLANTNSDSPERLKEVLEASRLASSTTWTSFDFLQDASRRELTTYTIHSNALGFRGREYTAEKPKDVFRIIVLGSYQAFGQGIEDDEAYPAVLESMLNENAPRGVTYEVWNGGRLAGTAIVGLARLTYEIFAYDPDLIILDYGHVDTRILGDDLFPVAMLFPHTPFFDVIKTSIGVAQPFLDRHSVLWNSLWHSVFDTNLEPIQIEQFQTVVQAMLNLTREKNVPVILVRQLPALDKKYFEPLYTERTDVAFLDTRDYFALHPGPSVPKDEWKTGYWAETWLSELDAELLTSATPARITRSFFEFYTYKLNVFQLNTLGQRAVAEALAEMILTDPPQAPAHD